MTEENKKDRKEDRGPEMEEAKPLQKSGKTSEANEPTSPETKPAELKIDQNFESDPAAFREPDQKLSAPAESQKIKFPIRTKLIIFFLMISLIPVLIVSVVSYRSSSNSLRDQALHDLTAVVKGRELAINRFLNGEEKMLRAFAIDGHIREYFDKIEQMAPGFENLSQELSSTLREEMILVSPTIYEITVLDLKGIVVASSDKDSIGMDRKEDDYFVNGKRGSYVKDAYFSSTTGKGSLAFSTPIRHAETGNVIGVLVSRTETKELNTITTNTSGLGETGEIYIVNKEGYMITDAKHVENTFLKQKVDTEPVRLFQREKKDFSGIYDDYRGRKVVGASMGSQMEKYQDLGWLFLVEVDKDEAFAPTRVLAKSIGLLALLIGILVTFIAYFMAKGISDPLRGVVEKMDEIARAGGDLTQEIPIRTSDELGLLAGSFNGIQKAFHKIISRISHASLSINSSSNEILAASNQQESSSAEQSAQITQIQATMNQFASTATQLASTAKEMGRFAEEVAKESQEGTNFIAETNAKMVSISESNGAVSNKLTVLSEKVEGIGKMLTTIISVADQTNLLSLNAAIEAAKAGEHGKGFNVVAQEIRRLADQTAQSSQEINSLINEIQGASSSSLMAMEKSSKDVAEGAGLVKTLANRFSGINERIENIQNQFESIVKGVEEQAAGNKEIASTLTQMTGALKLTAASSVQSRKSAMDLNTMSTQLRSAVGQFKLK